MVNVLLATVTHIYGLAFPRQTSSDAAEADAAAAALRGGIMAACFNGEGGRMQMAMLSNVQRRLTLQSQPHILRRGSTEQICR